MSNRKKVRKNKKENKKFILIRPIDSLFECLSLLINRKLLMNRANSNVKFIKRILYAISIVAIALIIMMTNANNNAKKLNEELAIEKDKKPVVKVIENKIAHTENKDAIKKEMESKEIVDIEILKNLYGDIHAGYIASMQSKIKLNSGEVKTVDCKAYGLGPFTTLSSDKYVINFMNYLKKIDIDMYNKYFIEVNAPGTATFNNAWQICAENEEGFEKHQLDFLYQVYVKDTLAILDKYTNLNSDDIENNYALRNLIYSLSTIYGPNGAHMIIDKAGIEPNDDIKTIVTKIEDERIESIGVYTFADTKIYSDKSRESVKTKVTKEKEILLNSIK